MASMAPPLDVVERSINKWIENKTHTTNSTGAIGLFVATDIPNLRKDSAFQKKTSAMIRSLKGSLIYIYTASMASMAARAPEVVPCTKVRDYSAPGPHVYTTTSQMELAYIDILVNLKMRLDSVKRMSQIQNTS